MSKLNIVVALSWEAKPVIRHFSLSDCRGNGPFPLYSDGEGITLIVAGVGQSNVALATAFLAGRQNGSTVGSYSWVNLGIAGHSTLPPGTAVLANKISLGSSSNQASYYPSMIACGGSATSAIVTVDDVETEYREEAAYEMEAYSFYRAASRFTALELIQVLKVISDGPQHAVAAITKESVTRWIENLLQPLNELKENLHELAEEYNAAYALGSEISAFVERWRFTASERQRLKRLYQYLSAAGEARVFTEFLEEAVVDQSNNRGAPILAALEQHAASLSAAS